MDVVTLLRDAESAGLRIEASGERLFVRGPKRAAPLVQLLAEHKTEVLAALAAANRSMGRYQAWGAAEKERAATIEHDGRIPREWAEGFA